MAITVEQFTGYKITWNGTVMYFNSLAEAKELKKKIDLINYYKAKGAELPENLAEDIAKNSADIIAIIQ